MSSTRVMLDHTAFPHLINLIFDYAPRTSLLVMRGVSREWRRRSDDMLASHVVLVYAQVSGNTVLRVTSPHGRLPSAKPSGASNNDPHQNRRSTQQIAERSRILEVSASVGCFFSVVLAFGNMLRVVKVRAPTDTEFFLDSSMNVAWPLEVPTVVTFSYITPKYLSENGDCTTFSVGRHFSAGKRFVLNIYVPRLPHVPRHQVEGFGTFPHNSETLEHVVLIFSTHAPTTTFQDSQRPPTTLKPLHIIATAFRATVSKTIKFTFVGAETVNRRWFGFPDDLADDDLVPAVAAAVRGLVVEARATRKLDWSDDEVDEVANAVEILTHDEYKTRLGEEQYVFETVEGGGT